MFSPINNDHFDSTQSGDITNLDAQFGINEKNSDAIKASSCGLTLDADPWAGLKASTAPANCNASTDALTGAAAAASGCFAHLERSPRLLHLFVVERRPHRHQLWQLEYLCGLGRLVPQHVSSAARRCPVADTPPLYQIVHSHPMGPVRQPRPSPGRDLYERSKRLVSVRGGRHIRA